RCYRVGGPVARSAPKSQAGRTQAVDRISGTTSCRAHSGVSPLPDEPERRETPGPSHAAAYDDGGEVDGRRGGRRVCAPVRQSRPIKNGGGGGSGVGTHREPGGGAPRRLGRGLGPGLCETRGQGR